MVTPWEDDAFITKAFQSWKKALYVEKNTAAVFEKHSQVDSHKSALERQITLASKSYGKIPKMASKSSASHQKGNREILMKILENVRFLGKIYLICFRMKLSIAFMQYLIQIFSDDIGKFEMLEYQKIQF